MFAKCGIWGRVGIERAGIALIAFVLSFCWCGTTIATPLLGDSGIEITAPADELAMPPSAEALAIELAGIREQVVDPPTLGLNALANAMREEPEISAILRTMMLDRTATFSGQSDVNLAQSETRAAFAWPDIDPGQPAMAAAQPNAAESPALEVDDEGRVSLSQVLQAIRGPDLGRDGPRAAPRQGDVDDPDDEIGITLDLRPQLLDSRFLGDALAQIVNVNSLDGTFSIFGLGHFTLDGHGATMNDLTDENALNSSLDMSVHSLALHRTNSDKVDALALLIAFLETPTGEFVAGFLATALVAWSTLRFAFRLRR